MKNKKTIKAIALVMALTFVLECPAATLLDGGWRLSVGAVYDSGVKSSLRYSPHSTYVVPNAVNSFDNVKKRWDAQAGSDKRYFHYGENNAESWISTEPATGERDGYVYYQLNRAGYQVTDGNGNSTLGKFTLERADYDNITGGVTPDGDLVSRMSDDSAMPGINVELSRNLYHNEEYGYGVDVAFAFQYARRNNIFKYRNRWISGYANHKTGTAEAYVQLPGRPSDRLDYETLNENDWLWNTVGGQTYFGNGTSVSPEIDDFQVNNIAGPEFTEYGHGVTAAHADYENLELMLLVRPYYDIFTWLRLNAQVGVVASRQKLDFAMEVLQAEGDYRVSRDYSQWDVYGVAGLGLMLFYRDFTLSADFMARFLDDKMSVDDRYVSGSVERGDWMFRLAIGYEF